MNSPHVFRDGGDVEIIMPNTSATLRGRKSNNLKCRLASNMNTNQNSQICNMENDSKFCSQDNENDLIEIQTIPLHFQQDQNRTKQSKIACKRESSLERPLCKNACYEHDNSLEDLKDTNIEEGVGISETPFTYENLNVEECLLDLDDYLENIEQTIESSIDKSENENCLADNIGFDQFKRDTQFRNTICCVSKNQTSIMKKCTALESPSIYATWSRQEVGNMDDKQPNKETTPILTESNLSVNKELTQDITLANESQASESPETFIVSKMKDNCLNSPNSVQILSNDQILNNLIEQNEINGSETSYDRPRQIGRRAERFLRSSITNTNADQSANRANSYDLRPMSAPALSVITHSEFCLRNPTSFIVSNDSSAQSSVNTSPASLESMSDSGESAEIFNNIAEVNTTNEDNPQQSTVSVDLENFQPPRSLIFKKFSAYKLNRMLTLIPCTLGLFNISRFACLTVNYGGNFLIQFLILSITFGIPFLCLQMCLGAKIKAGPISMWKISPICSGIGISLVLIQYFITIYSSVVVVWLLIYIGDLFIHQSSYPWTETLRSTQTIHTTNISINLTESISDYFNINVLQRLYILGISDSNSGRLKVNDRLVFYLAILWAIVFVIVSKGFKSFGKILFILGFLPLALLAAITGKLLYVADLGKIQNIFSSSEFDDFFVNSKTWSAAAQETFLTWGLLGASIIAISSRTYKNATKLTLRREAVLVVLITLAGLSLSALVGLCTMQILNQFGYIYVPGSYENPKFSSSIYSVKSIPAGELISFPSNYVPHYSGLIGEVYRRHADMRNVSGYQVLRFVIELLPAATAISTEKISWIWVAVIFITLLIFGLSQICVMWKPISNAFGNATSSVFLTCVTGLLLSIPFTTEIGITLLHYMDILMGGAWFIPVIWAAEIFGVFLIRGRPYNGDDLVNDLKLCSCMSSFVALSWNVLLPIGLLTLAVLNYKTSLSGQLYYWRGNSYFSYWSRKVGAFIQITFLLLIPLTAIVQIYRYLSSGPPDILDRIQMLYRPLDEGDCENRNVANMPSCRVNQSDSAIRQSEDVDAPPKYTPPPSYTTATGARLAKLFRQSIRRVLRGSERSAIPPVQTETQNDNCSSPPLYSSVQNGSHEATYDNSLTEVEGSENIYLNHRLHGRFLSLRPEHRVQNRRIWQFNLEQMAAFPTFSVPTRRKRILSERPYTAEDVITILRSSTMGRRRFSRRTRSIENLVFNAEPPDISSSEIFENLNRSN